MRQFEQTIQSDMDTSGTLDKMHIIPTVVNQTLVNLETSNTYIHQHVSM